MLIVFDDYIATYRRTTNLNKMSKSVLIVDDSLYMRAVISNILSSGGFNIVGQAADGESAIDKALELNPAFITLDNILPDMLGLDILRTLKEEGIKAKIIMISAVGQQSVINQALKLGIDGYLVKPFTHDQLLDAVKNII